MCNLTFSHNQQLYTYHYTVLLLVVAVFLYLISCGLLYLTLWNLISGIPTKSVKLKMPNVSMHINQKDAQISVIKLYFPLDALHVSDYISPPSGATFRKLYITFGIFCNIILSVNVSE